MSEIATPLTRGQFVRYGATGVALVAGGRVLMGADTSFAETVGKYNGSSKSDTEIATVAFAAETLAVAVYTAALGAKARNGRKLFTGANARYVKAALQNEKDHVKALSDALGNPAAPKVKLPKLAGKTDAGTAKNILKLGRTLEGAFVSAYIGAVNDLDSADLRQVAAQFAANEASHYGFFDFALGGKGVIASAPKPITIEAAGDALSSFFA